MLPSCGPSGGEPEGRQFDQKKIDSLNNQDHYDYYKEMEEYSNPILDFFLEIFKFIFYLFSNKIAFVILILVLIAVVIIIVRRGRSGLLEPIKENKTLTVVTAEDLEKTDYQRLLDLALAEGDLRLATRFTFLITLQYLQVRKKIDWHREKTNQEYLNELNPELKQSFSALVRAYEYVWYGEMEINIHGYHRVKGYFNHLKKIGS